MGCARVLELHYSSACECGTACCFSKSGTALAWSSRKAARWQILSATRFNRVRRRSGCADASIQLKAAADRTVCSRACCRKRLASGGALGASCAGTSCASNAALASACWPPPAPLSGSVPA